MAGPVAAESAISGGALEPKGTSSPSSGTSAIVDSLVGGLRIEQRIAFCYPIPSVDDPHTSIRRCRFLNRRSKSACATILGSDDDTIIERAYWVVRWNVPWGTHLP